VVNPPRELWGTSRYSPAFFMHPVSDNMPLNCLEKNAENPKNNLRTLLLRLFV
jgi:hypothetical protein